MVDATATTVLGNMNMNAMSRIRYNVDLVIPVCWFRFSAPVFAYVVFPFSVSVV
jgi:hypothetical protein